MEPRPKPVCMNVILVLSRSTQLEQSSGLMVENSGIFFLFVQCGMWIQNLELGKTESQKRKELREGQEKNRDGDLLNHPRSLISIT